MLLCMCQKNLHKIKKGRLNFAVLSTYPGLVKHLINARLSAVFFLYSSYFTKIKSKAISKKIKMIKEEIKKSFLFR